MENTYYNYGKEHLIAVDIETKDPNLKEKGPGVYREDGYITGVVFSNGELSEYYPIKHFDTSSEERIKNEKYIQDILYSNNRKVFANGIYDLDWMINGYGWKVNGQWEDIQIAEPLIYEYRRSYSLDTLSNHYLKSGKIYDGIKEYAEDQGWKIDKSNGVNHLWRMPQEVVKTYAPEDGRLTIGVFKEQESILKDQELEDIYRIEMGLYPLLLQMRKNGVRINKDKLTKTGIVLADEGYAIWEELNNIAGFEVNVGSGKDLEKLFNKLNVSIIYNEPTENMLNKGIFRGNPCFNEKALKAMNHRVSSMILKLRHIKTLLSLFIHPYPDLLVGDRLHCQFNQLKSDDYGTVSGRFSSSKPNLQQVSDTKEKIGGLEGKIIRKLFLPEEGCDWLKLDWSQIEFRLIAHYAMGKGADEIRRRYNKDPNTDYHYEVGEMAGIDNRDDSKILNFGTAYGMGVKSMAKNNGWELAYAKEIYNQYHKKVPFIKNSIHRVSSKAKRIGYIKTIKKRRARLYDSNKAYVMFNKLIQGSAADLMKKAMVDAYDAGIFNILIPHLTVHDELDSSMPKTKEGYEAGKELKYIMENCIKLKVPIIADAEIGPNWGEVKEWKI
jgi:DNA polymerase-1